MHGLLPGWGRDVVMLVEGCGQSLPVAALDCASVRSLQASCVASFRAVGLAPLRGGTGGDADFAARLRSTEVTAGVRGTDSRGREAPCTCRMDEGARTDGHGHGRARVCACAFFSSVAAVKDSDPGRCVGRRRSCDPSACRSGTGLAAGSRGQSAPSHCSRGKPSLNSGNGSYTSPAPVAGRERSYHVMNGQIARLDGRAAGLDQAVCCPVGWGLDAGVMVGARGAHTHGPLPRVVVLVLVAGSQ